MPQAPSYHKDRLEAAIEIWGEILNGSITTRKQLTELLQQTYTSLDIEPIRGKTKIDIYDKELATVFLVGKYGLGLEEELEKYRDLFSVEIAADRVLDSVLNGEDPRKAMTEHFDNVDENTVFRVLRLAMTATALNYLEEDQFLKVLQKFENSFTEFEANFLGFKRFYIAYKLAESIARGDIRNRIEKEALKHALCLRLGTDKAAPPDWLVREIAVKVLRVPEYIANDALSTSREEGRHKEELKEHRRKRAVRTAG